MKNIILIILLSILTVVAIGQESPKPPMEVRKAFILQYPDAIILDWKMMDNSYEASFKRANHQYTSLYTSAGVWIETSVRVEVVDLPLAVQEGFRSSNYQNWHVDNITKVELPGDKVLYRYYISTDGKTSVVNINETGSLMK